MSYALTLHPLQISIAMHALNLLKIGGRMTYSTCSFNPIENEAVVSEVLRRCGGSVRVVDTRHFLPQLKRSPGLKTWVVTDDSLTVFSSLEDVPEAQRKYYRQSMFPSPSLPAQHLEWCMRLFPHQQNTGGFFVCLLEKVGEVRNDECDELVGSVKSEQELFGLQHRKETIHVWNHAEYRLKKELRSRQSLLTEFYGIQEQFPWECVYTRGDSNHVHFCIGSHD